ncbi:MAG TPA: hypothetical protein VKI19_07565, partial [Acidimicrobiales bacterium]|nr:hypothetical protein [Acidimicrobiales bacterium]
MALASTLPLALATAAPSFHRAAAPRPASVNAAYTTASTNVSPHGPGQVGAYGDVPALGGPGARAAAPVGAMAATPTGRGYWLAGTDGGIFAYGDAGFHGSAGDAHLRQPIVGIAATPSGNGYWLVAADGGILTYGDAHFHGSAGDAHLSQPIVGMVATPDGNGYWLVAADGGIYAYG